MPLEFNLSRFTGGVGDSISPFTFGIMLVGVLSVEFVALMLSSLTGAALPPISASKVVPVVEDDIIAKLARGDNEVFTRLQRVNGWFKWLIMIRLI